MRQFLKQTFASLLGTLVGLILFVGLGTGSLLLLILFVATREAGPQVRDKSILTIDLSTQISDTELPSTLTETLVGEEIDTVTLREAIDAIEKAARDERIAGLLLDGSKGTSSTGYATLKEVRAALEQFRATGKPIVAYDVNWGEREYYLSSVADQVVLNPLGSLELNGIASEQLFFAQALDQLGIGVQVVRVGQYKSAVDPFIRQELSVENEQQLQALLDDLWQEFLDSVAQSREVSSQQLQQIANTQAILLAQEARSAGLVDRVAYFDQVIADLQEMTGSNREEERRSFPSVSLENYVGVPVKVAQERSSDNKIAVVYAEGNIVNGQGTIQNVGGDRYARILRQLRADDQIKAVVLRVNSPGGSATASEVILREVQLTSEKKPIIVSMGDVAASGGYWISAGADQIFAEPNTVTGSIGVFGLLFNAKEIANENGVTWDGVKTAQFADLGTLSRPKTEQELALYQKQVEQIYDQFLQRVSQLRDLPPQQVSEIAQGRVWSGEDALDVGLVDRLGGLDRAIAQAAKAAQLGTDWQVQEYPRLPSLELELLQRLITQVAARQSQPLDPISTELLKLRTTLENLQSLNDPRGIYARLPFDFWFD